MQTTEQTHNFKFFPFLVSLLITLAIGAVAGLVTSPQIAGWYSTLVKPAFNPPAWVFAPVYIIQLALNFSWSIVFFGFHSVIGGLLVIILLWMMILLNIRWFGKFSKVTGWLLLPYFLWVSFAAILNYSIYTLNR
jgi:tryptophan-rich sensory protein